MPHLTLPIVDSQGPLIKLLVGVSSPRYSALKNASLPVPQHIDTNFLIDTGASCTVIDEEIIKPLNLPPTGITSIYTPSTDRPEERSTYDISLMLWHEDNNRFFPTLPVVATNLQNQGIGGLLGRDVLSKCLLVYNGANNKYALAF